MSYLSSQITSLLVRLGFAIAGALTLGMALLTIFIYVGWLMHPGESDAAQLGSLGVVIGLPVGFVTGYLIAQQKRIRCVFLASSIGAFIGGIVGGYAVTVTEANLAVGQARAVIGLVFSFVGFAVGWFLAVKGTRLREKDKNDIPANTEE